MEVDLLRSLCLRTWIAVTFAACVALGACSKEEPRETPQVPPGQLPDQVISNFSITETAGRGQKEWTLEAKKADVYEKRNVLEVQLVKVTFYDRTGAVGSVLTAREGRIDNGTRDMEARGDVVVTGSDGVVLKTNRLTWENKARQIFSDDSVTVIRQQDVLTGVGFRGDPDLGKFEILKDLKATIRSQSAVGGGGGE